jgi:HK97 gp10 family phage protein
VLLGALKVGGERIADRAAELAPGPSGKDHPHLKDHIVVRAAAAADKDAVGPDAAAVVIGPTRQVFYGSFEEFGTVHQPARPWLRPAFDSTAEAALGDVAREIGEAWSKLGGTSGSGGGSE